MAGLKPRLQAQRLTREDLNIWDLVVERANWEGIAFHLATLHADRRDAALMLEAQRCRYRTFPVDMPPLELIGPAGVLVCGGAIFLPANPYPAAL